MFHQHTVIYSCLLLHTQVRNTLLFPADIRILFMDQGKLSLFLLYGFQLFLHLPVILNFLLHLFEIQVFFLLTDIFYDEFGNIHHRCVCNCHFKDIEKPLVLDQHALTEIVFVIHMCGKGTAAAILKAGQQLLHTTDIEYRSLIRKAMPGNRLIHHIVAMLHVPPRRPVYVKYDTKAVNPMLFILKFHTQM